MAGGASTSIVINIDTKQATNNIDNLEQRFAKLQETVSKLGAEQYLTNEYNELIKMSEILKKSAETAKTTFDKITLFTDMRSFLSSVENFNKKIDETGAKVDKISNISFKVDNIEFTSKSVIEDQLKKLQDICDKESKKIKLNIGVENFAKTNVRNIVKEYKKNLETEIKKNIESGDFQATVPLMYKYKVISQGYNTNNMNFNDIDTKREAAISKLTSPDLKRFGLTEEQTNQIKSEWNKNSQDLLATIENISNELTTKAQNIKITSGKNGINIVDNKSMNDTETQINELKQTISEAYDELLDVFDVKNKEARTKTYDLSRLIVEKLNQLKVLDPKAINLENITEAYDRQINTEAILKKANIMISEPDLLEYEDTEDKISQYNDLLGLLGDLKTAKGALSDKSFSKILSDNNINVTDINNKFKILHEGFVQTNVDFNELSGSATEFQTLIGEVFGNKYILPEFKGTGTGSGSGSGSGTGSGSGDSDFDNAEVEKLQQDYADLTAEVEKYKAQITEITAKLEEMKKTQAESEGDKSKIKELQASLDALNVSYAEAQNKMKEYRSELAAYESMSLVQDANGNNVNQEQYDKLISDAKQTATELENTRNQLKMLQEQAAAGGSDEYVVQLNNQLKSTEAMLDKVTNELEYMESSRNRWMDRAEMNAVTDESGQSVYQNDYDNIVAKLSEMKTEAKNAKDELEKLKATSVQLGEGEQVAKTSDIEAVKGLSEAVKSLQDRMTKAEEILQEVPKGRDGLKKLSSQIKKMSGNFNEDGSIKSMGISAETLSEQLKNLEAEFDARIAKKIEEIEKKSYKENQPDKKLTLVGKIRGLKTIAKSKPTTETTITKNDSTEKGINDYTKLITLAKQYNEIEAQHISTKNDKSVQIYQSKIDRLEKMKELIIQIRQETDNLNVSDEKIAEKLNEITLNDNSKSLAISDSKIFDTLLQMIETKIQNNQEVINKRQADLSKYDNYIKNFSSTIDNFKKTFQSILSIKMTKKNTDDIYNQLNTLFEDITTNLNLYNKYTDHPSYSENFAKQMNTLQAQVDKVATAIYQADDIGGKKETFEKSKAEFLIGYKPPKKKTEQVISNEPTAEDLRLIEQETQDRNKNAQAIDNEAEALSRYQELKEKRSLTSAERVEYSNLKARMSREQKSNIVSTGSSTPSHSSEKSGNATPPDNTTLSAILTEVKSINGKMDKPAKVEVIGGESNFNRESSNTTPSQSPNVVPVSTVAPTVSAEVQAASEASTAEVQAFTTIDDAVTGLTGHINTKTEAIRAEARVMIEASKQETQAVGRIVSGVIKLKEEIKSIPKISVTGKNTKAEPIKITAEISDEQIAKIRQRVLDAFGEKNPIPIFFKPNVQSIKKQINNGLKDGLEKLTIQSFDFENAAKDMKKTLAKAMSDVGLQFDTNKLRLDIKTAVNAARAAESAGIGNPSITASEKKNAKGGNVDPKKLDRLYASFERDVTSYYNRNTLILRDQEVNDLFSKILNDVKKQPKSKENLDVLYRRFSEAQIAAINKGLDFNADKSDIGTAVINKGYETLISQINKYLETNTKIIGSQFEEEFSKLLSEASKPAQARTDVDLKQLGAEFARLKNYVDEAGLSGNADNEAKKVSKLDRGYATLALDMKKFHEENNKLDKSTEWADKFNKLFNNITGSISRSEVELEDFRAQFANFKNEIPRDLLGSTVTSEFFENLKGYDIDSIAKIFEKQSGQVKSRLLNDKYGFESPKMTRDISQMLDAQADRLSGLINQENVSDNDIDGIVQHNKQMNNLIDTYQTYSEKRRELQELVSKDSSNEELKRLLQESDALSNSQVYDVQAMKSWSDSYVEAVNNLKTAQSNSEKEQRSSRATSTQQNQYRALTKDIEEATATAQRFKEQYAGLLSDGLNAELNQSISDMSARSGISVDLSNSDEVKTWNDESKKLLDTWTAIQERIKSSVVASGQAGEAITATMDYSQYTRKATNALSDLNSKYKDKLTDKRSAEFEQRLEAIRNKVKEISDDTSKYTASNVQVIETDIQQLEKLAKDFEVVQNSENKINSLIRTLSNSRNSIERRGSTAQPVVNSIDSEKAALEELKRQGQSLDIGNPESVRAFVEKLNEADTTVNKLKNDAEQIRISTNATASVAKLDSKFNDLLFKVDKFRRDNSKITSDKGISAQFDSLLRSIQTIEKSDVNFQRLRAQFDQLKATVQGKGLTGRSLGDELKYIAEKIGIKAMLGNSIYRVIGAFRQMVGIVTELDTGMTTLRRVTEATEATYRKFLKTAGNEAHELGSTVSGLVDSTGDFARLGYNIQEANALAKNAVMYSNVGWLDIQTATADMTSTMKAFNIEASDSIRIVDTFDILGKKLPLVTISVKGWRHSRPSKDIVNHNICVTTAGGVW